VALILVIDDDAAVRTAIRRVLESAGHTALEAPDGRAGLLALRNHGPELVITDILMPEKEGIETIREVRATAPTVKIIAASGDRMAGGPSVLDMALMLGAHRVIQKPFRRDELLGLVERLLQAP